MNFEEDDEQDCEDCEKDFDKDHNWDFEEDNRQDYEDCERDFSWDHDSDFEAGSKQNYEGCEQHYDRDRQDFASCEEDLLNSLTYIESAIWSDKDFNRLYMINLFLTFNKHFTALIKTSINSI